MPDSNLGALGDYIAFYNNPKCPVYFVSLKDLNYKTINGYIPPEGGWASDFEDFTKARILILHSSGGFWCNLKTWKYEAKDLANSLYMEFPVFIGLFFKL